MSATGGVFELDGCHCSKPKKREEEKTDANENLVTSTAAAPTQAARPASPPFTLEPYSLNFPRMGRCIIINQKFFAPSTNLDTRYGTDEDVRSLAWSFTRLHFQVDVIHNRTVDELRNVISQLSAFDHSRYASFVLCMLSHGDQGFVYGHDGKLLLREVLDVFSPERCPSLKGKPKLLILQACRGEQEDAGVPVKDKEKPKKKVDQVDANATPTLPEDFVLACATANGYVSYRDASTGTPFIQKLCRVFDSADVGTSHILDILTRVCHALSVEFGNDTNTKQSATVTSNLNKLFYLRPRPE